MKKVGKKGIKSRRMVKSTNKKAPKVEDAVNVSVKDAKAASKKGVKKAAKEQEEEDEEMTHTEVQEVTENAAEEEEEFINTQSKGRAKKPAAKRNSSAPKVGQKRLRVAPKKSLDEVEDGDGSEKEADDDEEGSS